MNEPTYPIVSRGLFAATLQYDGGKMSLEETITYLTNLIGSLEREKLYVHRSRKATTNERMKMVSMLNAQIYACHIGIDCVKREIERLKNGTTPTTV